MLATRASWKLRAELARRCNSPRLSSGGDAARFIVRAILAVIHVIPRELRHLFPARSQVPKEEGSYLAHLHFLSSLGDAVPAVVAIDVFKGLVPGVADTPVYLHGPVRSFTAEPVCPVVAHGNLVRQSLLYLGMGHLVHLPGGLADQEAQHLALCGELDQGPLDRLIARQLLAEGLAHASIFHGSAAPRFPCQQPCRVSLRRQDCGAGSRDGDSPWRRHRRTRFPDWRPRRAARAQRASRRVRTSVQPSARAGRRSHSRRPEQRRHRRLIQPWRSNDPRRSASPIAIAQQALVQFAGLMARYFALEIDGTG